MKTNTPYIPLASNQSIFTSEFFMGWGKYLPALNIPAPYFSRTDSDMLYFLQSCARVMRPNYVGLSSTVGGIPIDMDGVNVALTTFSYWMMAGKDTAEHLFPTAELVEALRDTDIKWVDFEHWKALPDFLSIRLPHRNILTCSIMGESYSVDDIGLARITSPWLRQHYAALQQREITDETEIWAWLTQSRDETDKGLQNTTFGSIILDKDTKLETVLAELVEYAARCDASLAKLVEKDNLLEWIEAKKQFAMTPSQLESAEYVKGSLNDRFNRLDENYALYKSVLEFILKFVTFRASEQFEKQYIGIPGYKVQKTSKKAKAIQSKLFDQYGFRYVVPLPPTVSVEGGGTHASPIRHRVNGFFRQQAHGPQNSLRKTIWVAPFWRGTNQIHHPEGASCEQSS